MSLPAPGSRAMRSSRCRIRLLRGRTVQQSFIFFRRENDDNTPAMLPDGDGFRSRGVQGVEGRLRGRRGGAGFVPPALRPRNAPRGGRWTRWTRRHARHAGEARRPGAVADPAFGGADGTPAVLHAAARSPTRRCRQQPSGRAIPCWSPRPAPGCWPSWPNARSGTGPPAPCT